MVPEHLWGEKFDPSTAHNQRLKYKHDNNKTYTRKKTFVSELSKILLYKKHCNNILNKHTQAAFTKIFKYGYLAKLATRMINKKY